MYDPYLEHSGVKGMHWGVRRYQNHDGSLTPAGRAHYGVGPARKIKSTVGKALKAAKKGASSVKSSVGKALKKVKKGASSAKKSTSKIVKTIKTKREERAEQRLTKAVAKGNVNNILKGVDRMSDKELKDALSRAQQVKALKDLKAPKKSVVDQIGDVATMISKGATAVSTIAKARQDRLKYRMQRDEYERDLAERRKEKRKQWEEEHANDPKFGERIKSALDGITGSGDNSSKPEKHESIRDRTRRLNNIIELQTHNEEVAERRKQSQKELRDALRRFYGRDPYTSDNKPKSDSGGKKDDYSGPLPPPTRHRSGDEDRHKMTREDYEREKKESQQATMDALRAFRSGKPYTPDTKPKADTKPKKDSEPKTYDQLAANLAKINGLNAKNAEEVRKAAKMVDDYNETHRPGGKKKKKK